MERKYYLKHVAGCPFINGQSELYATVKKDCIEFKRKKFALIKRFENFSISAGEVKGVNYDIKTSSVTINCESNSIAYNMILVMPVESDMFKGQLSKFQSEVQKLILTNNI